MIVHLDSRHYLTPLAPVTRGVSFKHMAEVDFDGHVAPAYVKIEDPGQATLVNEALGYLACRILNIPTPAYAAILDIEPHQLANVPGVPNWVFSSPGPVKAWAAEDMGADCLAQLYSGLEEENDLLMALMRSPDGPKIAALDEFLANADRNNGNVLHVSAAKFAAIDHGAVLGSPFWNVMGLNDTGLTDLSRHAQRLLDSKALGKFQSSVIFSADEHAQGWASIEGLARALLVHAPVCEYTQQVIPFLKERSAPLWMATRFGKVA